MKSDPRCCHVRLGGSPWCIRQAALKQVEDICGDVEAALSKAVRVYKNSRNVTAAAVVSASGRRLVVRRMNYGKWVHRFKDMFRPSRARRAFVRGLRLEQAGVPTPQMLAVAEVRRLRWPVAAYLICDEVAGAQTLAGIARGGNCCPRQVVEGLASVLARVHDSGFIHRDLKPDNLLQPGFTRNYGYLLPSFNWQNSYSLGKRLSVNYRSSVLAPSAAQLFPVIDITNPLSRFIGNQNLRPEYTHNLNFHWIWFDQFSFTSLFTNLNIQFVFFSIAYAYIYTMC